MGVIDKRPVHVELDLVLVSMPREFFPALAVLFRDRECLIVGVGNWCLYAEQNWPYETKLLSACST